MEKLKPYWLNPGSIVTYNGLPFLIPSGVTVLGTTGNAEEATRMDLAEDKADAAAEQQQPVTATKD